MNNSNVCRLCLESITNGKSEPLDYDKLKMLKLLFLKWDNDVAKNSVICSNCKGSLQLSFDFKTSCIINSDYLKTYLLTDDEVKHKFKRRKRVCQFCLNSIQQKCFARLNDELKTVLKEMFEKCLPELNMKITQNLLMCQDCMESLQVQFIFVVTCLDIEEKIRQFQSLTKTKCLKGIFERIQMLRESENGKATAEIKAENLDVEIKTENQNIDCKSDNLSEEVTVERNCSTQVNTEPKSSANIADTSDTLEPASACRDLKKDTKVETLPKKIPNIYNFYGKVKIYTCSEGCDYVTKNADSIKRHMLTHNVRTNRARMKIQHAQTNPVIKLKKIDKNLYEFQEVTADCLKDPLEVPTYLCTECDYRSTKSDVQVHIKKQHGQERTECKDFETYLCYRCRFKTKRKSCFMRHMEMHSNVQDIEKIQCRNKRPIRTKSKKPRAIHQNARTIKLYKCKECEYVTRSNCFFLIHKESHMDVFELTRFMCADCSYRTNYKLLLKRHCRTHYVTKRIFKCTECEYKTNKKKSLKRHYKSIHKVYSAVENLCFPCQQCSYIAVFTWELEKHKEVHIH